MTCIKHPTEANAQTDRTARAAPSILRGQNHPSSYRLHTSIFNRMRFYPQSIALGLLNLHFYGKNALKLIVLLTFFLLLVLVGVIQWLYKKWSCNSNNDQWSYKFRDWAALTIPASDCTILPNDVRETDHSFLVHQLNRPNKLQSCWLDLRSR